MSHSNSINYSIIVDCTQLLTDKCVYWPGGIGFSISPCCTYLKDGCCTKEITTELGIGTHVDAPMHFIEGGRSISEILPHELISNLVLIDVSNQCKLNSNYNLSVEDIKKWECDYGFIPSNSLVCMRTGWGTKFNDPIEYRNIIGNQMHFPGICFNIKLINIGFGVEAAKYLLTKNIVAVGIDTLSIDAGLNTNFEAHFEFLRVLFTFYSNFYYREIFIKLKT